MTEAANADAGGLAPNGWPKSRLAGFRAGERAALEAVYRDEVGPLMGFLRRGFSFDSRGRAMRFAGFRSAFELHDAVQESFRRAFEPRARRSYDGLRPFGAWLRVIARNVVLKEFRRRERLFVDVEAASAAAPGEAEAQAPKVGANPEAELHRVRVRSLVAEFLATLAPEERELLELRFMRGVGQRDAAEQLGIGRQRLRTREGRLKEQLVRFLTERGEDGITRGEGLAGGLALMLATDALRGFASLWREAGVGLEEVRP